MLRKNFFYNLLLTASGYFFTFISFPYILRVLGVENIGTVNFIDSIINYFIICSTLGVTSIGIREISKSQRDIEQERKIFRSIFSFHAFTTFIALIILFFATIFINDLNSNKNLVFIGALKLLSNLFLIEWFYSGKENFRLISLRSLSVKVITVILIFYFVKTKSDTLIYYLITSVAIVINAVINWAFLKISKPFDFKNIFIYKIAIGRMGVYTIMTSLYTTFNIIFLGFCTNNKEVGFYTTSLKLFSILLAIFTAFTSVMLPRMSSLLSEKRIDEFQKYIENSFRLLLLFSLPVILFTAFNASSIVEILFGTEYAKASDILTIMIPLLLVIGLEQVLVLQILMPLNMDKAVLKNAIIGAAVGLFLNIILVKNLQSIGTAIVWLFSELVVLICSYLTIKKLTNFDIPLKKIGINLLVMIPVITVLTLLLKAELSAIRFMTISFFVITLYHLIINIYVLDNKDLLLLSKFSK